MLNDRPKDIKVHSEELCKKCSTKGCYVWVGTEVRIPCANIKEK